MSTDKSNYQEARILIVSGLNIDTWEKHLQGYPDNRLLQYIRFGFSILIDGHTALHNTNIRIHHFALQFPDDINKYLRKVMLGPSDAINHTEFHCSPLMIEVLFQYSLINCGRFVKSAKRLKIGEMF